jgi:outer membrane protein
MVFFRSVRAGALAIVMCSVPAMAHAETLREALTSAYINNPAILSSLLNVKATAENIALAKAAKLPTIGANASLSQSAAAGLPLPSPQGSVGLQLTQNIFDNFKSDADIEAARALTEASRYSLQSSEQDVLLNVVKAYMGVIQYTQLAQLRQESVKFYQAQLQSANDKLKIGEGTKLDVSQAQARLAQATASYQSAITSLETNRATYERYVGHKPKNLSSVFNLGSLLPKSVDAAVNEAVASNPAILLAKATIRAQQANSDAANAAFGPTLSMVAKAGATLFGSTTPGSDVPAGSLTFNLNVPIYSGGALGANIRKANLNQIKSEVDALAARDQVKEATITAWATLQNATAQITSGNSAVSAGQLALTGEEQRRDVGQATTLDVLNAQAELETVQEGLIAANASRVIASYALVSATGHLTAADLGLHVEEKTGEDYIAKVEDVWAELRALD